MATVILATATKVFESVRLRFHIGPEEREPGMPYVRVYEQDAYGLKNWKHTVGRKFFTVESAVAFIKSKGYDVAVARYTTDVVTDR